jgi:RNA polymerase sigma-70 factor (ECF subfamily)
MEQTAELVIPTAASRGSDGAFEALAQSHRNRIFALASRLTGSIADAEEIVQDVLLRLHKHHAELPSDAAVRAWLRSVTLNLCRDRMRRNLLRKTEELSAVASNALSPEHLASHAERERLLRAALQRLTERERTALVLRELEGLTTAEVAAHMDVAEATVRVTIMQARLKLRTLLAETIGGGAR